jgi:hypothetical protein
MSREPGREGWEEGFERRSERRENKWDETKTIQKITSTRKKPDETRLGGNEGQMETSEPVSRRTGRESLGSSEQWGEKTGEGAEASDPKKGRNPRPIDPSEREEKKVWREKAEAGPSVQRGKKEGEKTRKGEGNEVVEKRNPSGREKMAIGKSSDLGKSPRQDWRWKSGGGSKGRRGNPGKRRGGEVAREDREARNGKKGGGHDLESEKTEGERAKTSGGKGKTRKQSERSGLREWKKEEVSKTEVGRKSLSKRETLRKKIRKGEERERKEREKKVETPRDSSRWIEEKVSLVLAQNEHYWRV